MTGPQQAGGPKARPILFSGPMIRALLEGRKFQTRRALQNVDADEHPVVGTFDERGGLPVIVFSDAPGDQVLSRVEAKCPYGKPGDLLWVRETWTCYRQTSYEYDEWEQVFTAAEREEYSGTLSTVYQVDKKNFPERWNPSIHMPRWASRLTLELTDVRVERLQEISEDACWAEGIEAVDGLFDAEIPAMAKLIGCSYEDVKPTYACLWDSINGKGAWDGNPWVFALSFTVHRQNVDALIGQRRAA